MSSSGTALLCVISIAGFSETNWWRERQSPAGIPCDGPFCVIDLSSVSVPGGWWTWFLHVPLQTFPQKGNTESANEADLSLPTTMRGSFQREQKRQRKGEFDFFPGISSLSYRLTSALLVLGLWYLDLVLHLAQPPMPSSSGWTDPLAFEVLKLIDRWQIWALLSLYDLKSQFL